MGMWHMGSARWAGIFIFLLGLLLTLSKRDLLRLSKKSSMDADYGMEYEDDEALPDLKLIKRDLLRLSKKSLFQEAIPLHMSQRSLRLSKRSPALDQPMVIRLSKRQIGQLLQIKRGARDLRLSKRGGV